MLVSRACKHQKTEKTSQTDFKSDMQPSLGISARYVEEIAENPVLPCFVV